MKNDYFANAFIGMFKADFNSYNARENTVQEKHLILDSGASYHCFGLKHSALPKEVEILDVPKLGGTAGSKIY
eukprot:snap_masked-scaffold_39-processed-gene-2.39-mRNA-1 protein AED:1.00 eAED:1.00 QI:0/-1/0/0/-1/1/1/0/72